MLKKLWHTIKDDWLNFDVHLFRFDDLKLYRNIHYPGATLYLRNNLQPNQLFLIHEDELKQIKRKVVGYLPGDKDPKDYVVDKHNVMFPTFVSEGGLIPQACVIIAEQLNPLECDRKTIARERIRCPRLQKMYYAVRNDVDKDLWKRYKRLVDFYQWLETKHKAWWYKWLKPYLD